MAQGAAPADWGSRIEADNPEGFASGAQQTQEQMAATLGLGQDTISRLGKGRDMLLPTLSHHVQSMGGQVNLLVLGRPPIHGHRTFWCETFSDPTVSIGPASARSLFLDPQ